MKELSWWQVLACFLGSLFLGFLSLPLGMASVFQERPTSNLHIALTFDDGPHPNFTKQILDILKTHRVPSTFFVVGQQGEKHPNLLNDIVRHGHELANHSFTHRNLTKLTKDAVKTELHKTENIIQNITHRRPHLFRPPGGQTNVALEKIVVEQGYRTIMWTVLPKDHEAPAPQIIIDRVLKGVTNGGVVLLHSGVKETLTALPLMIQALRDQGFIFHTVSGLMQQNVDVRVAQRWQGKKDLNYGHSGH